MLDDAELKRVRIDQYYCLFTVQLPVGERDWNNETYRCKLYIIIYTYLLNKHYYYLRLSNSCNTQTHPTYNIITHILAAFWNTHTYTNNSRITSRVPWQPATTDADRSVWRHVICARAHAWSIHCALNISDCRWARALATSHCTASCGLWLAECNMNHLCPACASCSLGPLETPLISQHFRRSVC